MNLARVALLVAVCLADGILLLKSVPAFASEIITDAGAAPTARRKHGPPA